MVTAVGEVNGLAAPARLLLIEAEEPEAPVGGVHRRNLPVEPEPLCPVLRSLVSLGTLARAEPVLDLRGAGDGVDGGDGFW